MKLSQLLKVLDDQDVITIHIKNAELFHGQLETLDLKEYEKIEEQTVISIQNEIIERKDELFVNIHILLDYKLKFGEQNV